MDSRKNLLNEFFSSLDRAKAKIELRENSFDDLDISNFNFKLSYGEFKDGVLKYKLSGISLECFEHLIDHHLRGKINLCAYFNSQDSCLFALNLDDNSSKKTNDVKVAALLFIKELQKFNIVPLVIKSGHGYHLWCRLSSAVKNETLRQFTAALKNLILLEMFKLGASPEYINCTTYPRLCSDDISIRLFGGIHSKTGQFSWIVTAIDSEDTILSVDDSWAMFEWYISNCLVSIGDFNKALKVIAN
ncbi:hypothetical protein REC12_00185 [Desulfosporosinus sp. PR]|uniref:TOTE conflict system archaeo-eukaryotic primase domain-containing protein n=1 Tax=Candidatus Desulfosporosinus nitrosoreducens TaxID=3401928 RepID=UPI0027EA8118|nr:hypothetical protein [Desulfosporosinus sp. PR]MDQ7092012.1 hypothetical protein [Desulfosporosinus sp. PR]